MYFDQISLGQYMIGLSNIFEQTDCPHQDALVMDIFRTSRPNSLRMKKSYSDLNVLDETDRYLLGHYFEDAYIIDKQSGDDIFHDDFYGDPTCGLISRNNDWAVIAGEHITVWKNGKGVIVNQAELRWVHSLRTKDQRIIEILIDPWADHSAIWTLDITNMKFQKVRDFNDYKDENVTDNLTW
ncbi:hypothetical protein [Chryseolinea lacunae]|uniref:Uncharacterized protein n=1 Tax=Chryseolinea lacunae TaxID=2801331 RepID=A0ABS1KUW7_9BACT|nr:hypothetical protein [Chryseolinea lacunae]MBL0743199.1 hypothetical protein [Chryseolinea lacunae]